MCRTVTCCHHLWCAIPFLHWWNLIWWAVLNILNIGSEKKEHHYSENVCSGDLVNSGHCHSLLLWPVPLVLDGCAGADPSCVDEVFSVFCTQINKRQNPSLLLNLCLWWTLQFWRALSGAFQLNYFLLTLLCLPFCYLIWEVYSVFDICF